VVSGMVVTSMNPPQLSTERVKDSFSYIQSPRSTFDRLEIFRQSMLRVQRQKPIFMLVGNKCDKTYEREVSKEALARSFGCQFMETSAKTAQNVERIFTSLVRALRNARQPELGQLGVPVGGAAMQGRGEKETLDYHVRGFCLESGC